MRSALVALAVCVGLLAVPPLASAAPHLTASDRSEIGSLLDRFVKEAVRREDLPAAWELAGPDLRGGTTKAAWDAGRGVTVQQFPALGADFSHAWTGQLVAPNEVAFSMMLHPQPGHPKVPQTAFRGELLRRHGRWIVDTFYPAAMFYGNGKVEGPNDFQAGANAVSAASDKARIGARWLAVAGIAVAALVVLLPAGFWVRAKRRERRALAAYLATRH